MATINSKQVTVTTAATRVAVSSVSLMVSNFVVKALAANTGKMYVGDVTVSATVGYQLSAGEQTPSLPDVKVDGRNDMVDLAKVYIDSSVNGEKVSVIYFT